MLIQWDTPYTISSGETYSTTTQAYYTANKTFVFPIAYIQRVSVFGVGIAMEQRGYQDLNYVALTGFKTYSNTVTSGTGGWIAIGY